MKAIETTAWIDNEGKIHTDEPLPAGIEQVKIIILLPEDEDDTGEGRPPTAPDILNEPAENTYTLPDEKLLANVTREIKRLPEHLLPELQKIISGLLTKKQPLPGKERGHTYEERLKIIMEAGKYLTEKENFDQYMKDFEESTQDRPLPFREP